MGRLDGGARPDTVQPDTRSGDRVDAAPTSRTRPHPEVGAPARPRQEPPPLVVEREDATAGGHRAGDLRHGDLAEPVEAVVQSLRRGWMPVQVPSFLVVGGLTFVVDASTFQASIWAGATPGYAFALGYAVGIATHFTLNRTFTFWARGPGLRRQLALYAVNAGVCLVLQWAILSLGLHFFPTAPLVWKSIAVVVTMALTYLWLRTVVFVRKAVDEG